MITKIKIKILLISNLLSILDSFKSWNKIIKIMKMKMKLRIKTKEEAGVEEIGSKIKNNKLNMMTLELGLKRMKLRNKNNLKIN
jgi:hypothetical protein